MSINTIRYGTRHYFSICAITHRWRRNKLYIIVRDQTHESLSKRSEFLAQKTEESRRKFELPRGNKGRPDHYPIGHGTLIAKAIFRMAAKSHPFFARRQETNLDQALKPGTFLDPQKTSTNNIPALLLLPQKKDIKAYAENVGVRLRTYYAVLTLV